MQIRAEEERDRAGIRIVNESAFETAAEANLVFALREVIDSLISLVAEDQGEIIGHIMFSPVTLTGHPELEIMGLAPMAVMPEYQRKGVGSALVRAGLEACKKLEVGAIVVLGHSGYYQRFGFVPSSRFGIHYEHEVPENLFMIKELREGYLHGSTGTIKYHEAFRNV